MAEVNLATSSGVDLSSEVRRRTAPLTQELSRAPDHDAYNAKELKQEPASFRSAVASWEPMFAPLFLTALAIFTRMYHIGRSDIVTWDEAQ
ncbi:protein O-mannosyltransferase 2 [Aspergillus brasiliensis]|nr:protein O-mannosyltransferase 2 [Aspergillus brasiliensis]